MGNLMVILNYIAFACAFLPAIFYSIIFGKFAILWEVVIGSLAYLFYVPTEYCILQMYARCRMDDVFGKNSAGLKNQKLRETWKVVKMVEVTKYFFWNSMVALVLLILHGKLYIKFFLFLALFIGYILFFFIKWIPGLIYIIRYRCRIKDKPL